MRAALIRDGLVENVVVVDPDGDYEPDEGLTLVDLGDEPVGPGWTYDGEAFAPPDAPDPGPAPEPGMTLADLAAAYADLRAELDELADITLGGEV